MTWLLGALRILGREDLIGDIMEYNRKAVQEFGDHPTVRHQPDCFREARKLGVVGCDYFGEPLHVQPDSRQTDPDAGVTLIRAVAKHIAAHLPALSDHVNATEPPGTMHE